MSLTLEWRHRIMAWREELSKHFYLPLGEISFEASFTKDQYRLDDAQSGLSYSAIAPGQRWGAKWGVWLVQG
jgi:alpha-mannosidase